MRKEKHYLVLWCPLEPTTPTEFRTIDAFKTNRGRESAEEWLDNMKGEYVKRVGHGQFLLAEFFFQLEA